MEPYALHVNPEESLRKCAIGHLSNPYWSRSMDRDPAPKRRYVLGPVRCSGAAHLLLPAKFRHTAWAEELADIRAPVRCDNDWHNRCQAGVVVRSVTGRAGAAVAPGAIAAEIGRPPTIRRKGRRFMLVFCPISR